MIINFNPTLDESKVRDQTKCATFTISNEPHEEKFLANYLREIYLCLNQKVCLHVVSGLEDEISRGICETPLPGSIEIFTSGSTGAPKRVTISLRDKIRLFSDGLIAGTWFCGFALDKWAAIAFLAFVTQSENKISVPASLALEDFRAALFEDNPVLVSTTPSIFRKLALSKGVSVGQVSSVKQITLGGEWASQSTINIAKSLWPESRVTHVFATTETGELFAASDGLAGYELAKVLRSSAVRVTDDGELIVNGLGTGDFWEVSNGRLVYLGRKNSFINVGGQKVYPQEIEEFTMSLTGVTLAKVTPRKSPLLGEIAALEYEGEATEDFLRSKLREGLPKFKVPGLIRKTNAINLGKAGKK